MFYTFYNYHGKIRSRYVLVLAVFNQTSSNRCVHLTKEWAQVTLKRHIRPIIPACGLTYISDKVSLASTFMNFDSIELSLFENYKENINTSVHFDHQF